MLEEVLCLSAFVGNFHLKSITSLNIYSFFSAKNKRRKTKKRKATKVISLSLLANNCIQDFQKPRRGQKRNEA